MVRAIDTFVNVNMGSVERPPWLVRVAEDYFNRADAIFKDIEIPELIEAMDRAGVEKCILSTTAEAPAEHVLKFPRAHPDKFVLSLSDGPAQRHAVAARAGAPGAQRAGGAGAHHAVHGGRDPAEREGVLPRLREVHRPGPADRDQHRHPRTADARQVPGPHVPGRGVRLLPGAEAGDGPRRRPVVGRRDPADDRKVSQPLLADVGACAALLSAAADPVHEHARPGQDHVRVRPPGAVV